MTDMTTVAERTKPLLDHDDPRAQRVDDARRHDGHACAGREQAVDLARSDRAAADDHHRQTG
jgi:hypothetical protein